MSRRLRTLAALLAGSVLVVAMGGCGAIGGPGQRGVAGPATGSSAAGGSAVPEAIAPPVIGLADIAPAQARPADGPVAGLPGGIAAAPGPAVAGAVGGMPAAAGPGEEGPAMPYAARSGLPPAGQEPLTPRGVRLRLDETASLACAHAQFALEALEGGDQATFGQELAAVGRWGGPSANASIAAAARNLAAAAATATAQGADVEAFLAVCTANGHVVI